MKVKIMKPFVLHNGKSWEVGTVQDIEKEDAIPLIRGKFVVPATKKAEVEKAVAEPVMETREDKESE